jgi:rhodanese-related sulfurtransferase
MASGFLMGRELRRVLVEALVVSGLGLTFALVANLASPRGLSLTRNYFPAAEKTAVSRASGVDSNPIVKAQAANQAAESTGQSVTAWLKEKGLQSIDLKQAQQLFRDPHYEQELTVFVDARDDRHYQEGHIPGAYQFDRYYPEKHLPQVLPACLTAMTVMVYCTGGNCEDSEFAAAALRDTGVAQNRLLVYTGGITEWVGNGLPIELGERRSGNLRSVAP